MMPVRTRLLVLGSRTDGLMQLLVRTNSAFAAAGWVFSRPLKQLRPWWLATFLRRDKPDSQRITRRGTLDLGAARCLWLFLRSSIVMDACLVACFHFDTNWNHKKRMHETKRPSAVRARPPSRRFKMRKV